MSEDDSLARLQGLQADLVAFAESRLPNFDRLFAELEASIDDFRKVLGHKPKSDASRKELAKESVKIDEQEYSLNDEFRQEAIQIADELDLDEIEAAALLLQAQTDQSTDRPSSLTAIVRYHGHSEALLGALRLILHHASDQEAEFEGKGAIDQVVQAILQQEPDKPPAQSLYWRKCFGEVERIEGWVKRLKDRLASMTVIGQTERNFALEALEFQRDSLLRQHENLAAILCLLTKMGYTSLEDYRTLLKRAATFNTFDEIVVHYVPALIVFAYDVGSNHGQTSPRDARGLDLTFADKTDATKWGLPDFRAASSVFWLAEYSARYAEDAPGSPIQGVDPQKEADARSDRVIEALRESAFQFILLIYSKVRPQLWHDPAKSGLIAFMLGESRLDRDVPISTAPYFDELLSLHLQLFIDALITNMPDTIRRLKYEEDDERRNTGAMLSYPEQQNSLHLERFMVIISYAFSGSAEAALQTFWSDMDGNMYGFLQWASKRQSTPRAAAFCEMFQALAESTECAEAANRFLLEDAGGASNAKLRRGVTLNWSQVFSELTYYADRLRESPSLLTAYNEAAAATIEPESALMLECYLRLTTHLCRTSASAREFLLNHPDLHLHEVLFDLCRSGIDSRFKACAFNTLSSLLTDKSVDTSYGMWEALDGWICGATQAKGSLVKLASTQPTSDATIFARLQSMTVGFEEPNAFVRYLQHLIELPAEQQMLNDALPFAEQLGASYRMSGIDQYVDFVLGSAFIGVVPSLESEQHIWELRCACLDFIRVALSTFNEDLVIFANTTNINVDNAIATSSLETYVKLHPFARVMEWMFNDAVITQLFAASHHDADALASLPADSPTVTAVARSIQVIDLVLRLQATYLDVVRPIIKTRSASRSRQVANPTLASFEDAILSNLRIVVDLGLYCSTAFEHLTALSLDLLQRLAQSRKLTASSNGFSDGRSHPSRLVAALQQSSEVDRISTALLTPLKLDAREIEAGENAPGHRIKLSLLDLLNKSLATSSTKPGLAHCLLGFECTDRTIKVADDSRFSKGTSLFHTIAQLYAETAVPDQSSASLALATLRSKASQVLQKLFRSPLTSEIVLAELRDSGFTEAVAMAQSPVLSTFGERIAAGLSFLATDLAPLFRDTLIERLTYFEHQALELRTAMVSQSISLQEKTRSIVLGLTRLPDGREVQHANLFDLFDFFELDFTHGPALPKFKVLTSLDFSTCRKDEGDGTTTYDLRLVNELILLRAAELRRSGQIYDESKEQQCEAEIEAALAVLSATNVSASIAAAQRAATIAWTQLVTVMLTSAGMELVPKTAFILQALQVVLPKIQYGLAQDVPAILPLARLICALIRAHDIAGSARGGESAAMTDRLLVTFRTALGCIVPNLDSVALRETSYQIVSRVLVSQDALLQRNARKAVESAGERLLDVATEDAFSSSASARTSALVALRSLVQLFSSQKRPNLIRALSRLNFIQILVDNIRSIPLSFAEKQGKADLDSIMSWIRSSLALLLQVAGDPEGATAVLEAGLFPAIRDSGLFTADPEIGDDSEDALERFYGLLVGVLRIVGAVVLVKGVRNDIVTAAGRAFLNDGRSCFLSVLKATKKDAALTQKTKEVLLEVLDGFQVVVWATGWLESEGNRPAVRKGNLTFT